MCEMLGDIAVYYYREFKIKHEFQTIPLLGINDMIWKLNIFLTLLFFISCQPAQDTYETFKDLNILRNKIEQEYKENISINISNTSSMTIGLINSDKKDLPKTEKVHLAWEIAKYAFEQYKDPDDLFEITVIYTVTKNYIILNYTNAWDAYKFYVSDLISDSYNEKEIRKKYYKSFRM